MNETGDALTDSIAKRLQQLNVGVVGQTIFSHFIPHEVQRGILIMNNLHGPQTDPDIPNYRRGKFRLVVRAKTHKDAFDLIHQAIDALNIFETQLDSIKVKYMRNENDPIAFPFAYGSNALEVSCTFNTVFTLT